jgi:flagellar motility protein MotE (MotC chaperone)
MKAVMIGVPVVILAIVGLGMSGIINIPGLSPKKKAKIAAATYTDKEEKPAKDSKPKEQVAKKDPPPKPKVEVSQFTKDSKKGAEALAEVWNEVKVPELATITASWKEDDLAKVLAYMDTGKVAKFLEQIAKGEEPKVKPNPTRASNLSKRLQELGSIIVVAQS